MAWSLKPVIRQPLGGLLVGFILLASGCTLRAEPPAPIGAGSGQLTVNLVGFRNDRGTVMVSLFASGDGFPDDIARSVATRTVPIDGQDIQVQFRNLPYGAYAVSVLHDENTDGRMATSWLGTPREGFGFSGHPAYRMGRPAFADTAILLTAPTRTITISLRYETGRQERQAAHRGQALQHALDQ